MSVYIETRIASDGKKRYRVRADKWVWVNGKKQRRSKAYPYTPFWAQAAKKRDELQKRKFAGKLYLPDVDAPKTLGELQDRLERDRKPQLEASTWAGFWAPPLRHLIAAFGKERPLESLTRDDLVDWRNKLAREPTLKGKARAHNGVEILFRGAGTIFSYSLGRKWIAENPVHSEDRPRPRPVAKILSPSEFWQFLDECSPRLRRLQLATALLKRRIGEMLHLDHKMIDREKWTLTVEKPERRGIRDDWDTKTREAVTIPIPKAARPLLGPAQESGRVFPEFKTANQVSQQVRRVLARLRKRDPAGPWDRLRNHDMRHNGAALYLRDGGSLDGLQRILAHRDRRATDVYKHLILAVSAAEMERGQLKRP